MESDSGGGGSAADGMAIEGPARALLDELRGGLQLDGGDLLFERLSADGVLHVRLTGCHACCPMAVATLRCALAAAFRRRLPAVSDVVFSR
jgi:Fe-S cluster biogenesis protein NfuA